jgi:hypothetical protein
VIDKLALSPKEVALLTSSGLILTNKPKPKQRPEYLSHCLTSEDIEMLKGRNVILPSEQEPEPDRPIINCIARSLTQAELAQIQKRNATLSDVRLTPRERVSIRARKIAEDPAKPRIGRPPKPPVEPRNWRSEGRLYQPDTLCCDKCYSVVKRITSNQKYCNQCGPIVRREKSKLWNQIH